MSDINCKKCKWLKYDAVPDQYNCKNPKCLQIMDETTVEEGNCDYFHKKTDVDYVDCMHCVSFTPSPCEGGVMRCKDPIKGRVLNMNDLFGGTCTSYKYKNEPVPATCDDFSGVNEVCRGSRPEEYDCRKCKYFLGGGYCSIKEGRVQAINCKDFVEPELMEDRFPECCTGQPWSMEDKIIYTVDRMKDVLIEKNIDYGNSFETTLDKYGDTALMLRLEDKFNRLESLFKKKENLVKDESFEDTVRDLAGYCLLYLSIRGEDYAKDTE